MTNVRVAGCVRVAGWVVIVSVFSAVVFTQSSAPSLAAGRAQVGVATTTTAVPSSSSVVPPRAATAIVPTSAPAPIVPKDADRPKPAYVDSPQGARQKAAAYAFTWALKTNPAFALFYGGKVSIPSDNLLEFGRAIDTESLGELDCTNFMSQALRTGEFTFVSTWNYNDKQHLATTAWVRASGPKGLAATFVRLGRMKLMAVVGSRLGDPPPPGIQVGDIVVWDLNDRSRTMFIDHQLMVTEVSGTGLKWADIRVSYHTYDHRNRAMDEYQAFVSPDAPRAKLYVFHVNYSS